MSMRILLSITLCSLLNSCICDDCEIPMIIPADLIGGVNFAVGQDIESAKSNLKIEWDNSTDVWHGWFPKGAIFGDFEPSECNGVIVSVTLGNGGSFDSDFRSFKRSIFSISRMYGDEFVTSSNVKDNLLQIEVQWKVRKGGIRLVFAVIVPSRISVEESSGLLFSHFDCEY